MVEWAHIQIGKQSPSTNLDKYWLLGMSKEVAEGVRMQCGQEYFPKDKQDSRAAPLYTMTEERNKKHSHRKHCH